MKVAYLILAHDRPDQLARLVGTVPADAPVFIHFDKKAEADYQRARTLLADRPHLHIVKRERCYWGSFGIVGGTINLVRALVASGETYDYAILLSGTDYPALTESSFQAWLSATPGSEHMESFALDAPNRWDGDSGPLAARNRYRRFHIWLRSRFITLWKRGIPRSVPRLYGGSQWWCLTRGCIEHVDAFIRANPAFVRYFRGSVIPDEAFFQSIVSNSPFAGAITGQDTKFAIWGRPNPPYPAILKEADFAEIVGSGKPYARKFYADHDSAILDRIDRYRVEG